MGDREKIYRRGRRETQREDNQIQDRLNLCVSLRPPRLMSFKVSSMPLEQVESLIDQETPDKDFLYTLNFGPQHPATHTTLRLILTLDGETVVKAVPDIGFLHSGFEKLGEHLDFNQYVTIVDRMNYISPVSNEIAWHHVVEN